MLTTFRYRRRNFAIFLSVLLLESCAPVPFLSGEIRISAAELTQKMALRFPLEKSVAGLLEVTLARPVVELNADENRLSTSFEINVKLPLTSRNISGALKISGRPEYVVASRALFLRGVRVERIRMDNMPDALSASLAKAASTIGREVLEDKPLYIFTAEEFIKYGARYEPERVEVRADALVLKVK